MYLLIDQDGGVTEVDEMPSGATYGEWPKIIKIALYYGPDIEAFVLDENNDWVAV
jgi:hypothetical protein